MRRLLTVLATTGLLGVGLVATAGTASADLRDDCYDRASYRGAIVCNKLPGGLPSPFDLG